jgi:hypothetical protein
LFLNRRHVLALLLSGCLALPSPVRAYETPLSDSAVREAYFLGQHHDEIYSDFLSKYGVTLPIPKSGPHIASVSFLTPYALTAMNSNQKVGTYSAQQAQIDHDKQPEVVRVVVEVWLTASYGAYVIQPPVPHTTATSGYLPRSPDFWRDFRVRTSQNDKIVVPSNASGDPHWNCGEDSGCQLSGATLTFDYPASAFSPDTVTVLVTPPEGDSVSADFDPTSLR